MKNLDLKISVSFPSTGREEYPCGKFAQIDVVDQTSRLPVVRFQMTMEEFALALSSVADRPATGEIFDNRDFLGKTMEHQVIPVTVPSPLVNNEEDFWAYVHGIVSDRFPGWRVDKEHRLAKNSYRMIDRTEETIIYRITIRRYV